MLDLEDELRNVLHDRAGAVQPSDDLDARIVRHVRRTIRTRRLATAFVAAAVLAGTAVVTTSVVGRDDRGPTVSVVP